MYTGSNGAIVPFKSPYVCWFPSANVPGNSLHVTSCCISGDGSQVSMCLLIAHLSHSHVQLSAGSLVPKCLLIVICHVPLLYLSAGFLVPMWLLIPHLSLSIVIFVQTYGDMTLCTIDIQIVRQQSGISTDVSQDCKSSWRDD